MKKSVLGLLVMVAGVVAGGCQKKPAASPQPTNPPATASGNPLTAPVDYLGTINEAKKHSIARINYAQVTHAIQQFQAMEERYPKDLNELVSQHYLGSVPNPPAGMKFDYNPTTGALKVIPK